MQVTLEPAAGHLTKTKICANTEPRGDAIYRKAANTSKCPRLPLSRTRLASSGDAPDASMATSPGTAGHGDHLRRNPLMSPHCPQLQTDAWLSSHGRSVPEA